MREIYKPYSLKGKKQMKTTTFSVALLVAATLILTAAMPAMSITNNPTKLNEKNIKHAADPAGLDPKWANNPSPTFSDLDRGPQPIAPLADTMYGFICYGASSGYPNGPCYWPLDDPEALESIASYSGNWMAGATWTCDERWIACQYGTGILFVIDPETGDVTSIGGGGESCNGLGWDPVYNKLYGTSNNNDLILYDVDTGEQENLGHLAITDTLISLQVDREGICTAYDVKYTGNAKLYTIDLEAVEVTDEVDMGENLLYAQDGAYDWETGILWLAGYSSTGFLGYWDPDAQEIVHIGNFKGGAEIAGAMIQGPCIPPEHDVAVKEVVSPDTGPACENMPMQVLVKNTGNNTETFNCQLEVIKCEAGPFILEEYFDGETFPPEGWETDWWKQIDSNVAGGDAPEARVYKYDQYYGGQTYDNYIQTSQIDCTGLEKVNLKFLWASDLSSGQYCSAFVKFRRNSTSPWKDVTPWDNPIGSSQDPDAYEIGCYGFGEPIGTEFQMRFEYIGYYSYYNYFWLDDVTLEACGGCAEYADLVEYITLNAGDEYLVEFDPWTPSEWHNESSENTWEEYPLHAWVDLVGDQNPRNDEKWKLIDLWYPWMHDVSIGSIDSPSDPGDRSLPAQTFPVQATMFNAGQYPECCIPIQVQIGEKVIYTNPVNEYDWPGDTNPQGSSYYRYYPGYDNGWRDEHKSIAYYYGWYQYSGSYSGGESPENYLRYYYARADYAFYIGPFDVSEYETLDLSFKSYINHYSGQGLYSLEAGYSFDLVNWYAVWHEDPGSSQQYSVETTLEGGHETMYFGFWCKGDPWYFNYWYIDDVVLISTGLTEEFTDNACQGPDIQPGEYVTFDFDEWTPEYLAEETSHPGKEYIAQATIEMEGDKNPGNDLLQTRFTLVYWHDVGIDAVTSPANSNSKDDVLWDNGLPNGNNGLAGSMYYGYSNIIIDDFENEKDWVATDGHFRLIWNSAAGAGNLDNVMIYFFEETGDCEPAMTEYAVVEATAFNDYTTGDYYFSRPEVAVDVEFDDVELPAGKWWVGFQPDSVGEDLGYMLTADHKGCEIEIDLPYWGIPRWTPGSSEWGSYYDLAWALTGISTGPPSINTYIQPGSEGIGALVKNYGTFKHMDLTCYAEVWEYITDVDNGTQIFSEQIDDIDLDTPLGGTESLDFGSCTFAEEGRYGLYLNMPPTTTDDDTGNNKKRWGIAVDDTPPDIILDVTNPTNPDGLEGWYVNDVEIFVEAADPLVKDVSSGVKQIHYSINGAEDTLPGSSGTIVITQDGKDISIKYWAEDNVGNINPVKNETIISMDQTAPSITFAYEQVSGGPIPGAVLLCTMNATDAMSTMNRVEFYLNDVLQDTVSGEGPVYQWDFKYHGVLNIYVTAIAYDDAGNSDLLIIDEFEIEDMTPRQHSSNNTPRAHPHPR